MDCFEWPWNNTNHVDNEKGCRKLNVKYDFQPRKLKETVWI